MNSRRKILLVIRQLQIGGAESQAFELAKRLDKNKFEVVVCALQSGGYFSEKLVKEGIPVCFVAKRWRYDFTVLPRLVALFSKEKPDIVHCVMWTANMWGGLAAKLARVPKLLLSSRNLGIWKNKVHYLTGPFIFNLADLNLANSTEVKNYMIHKEGVRPDLVSVVYNGLDLERFVKRIIPEEVDKTRLTVGLPSNGPVVGIVANLAHRKDYPTFLRAASRVAKKNREVRFLVVGEGDLRSLLETETKRLGLQDRVVFAGQRPDVERCLACMDIFVLSSIREGFSNALIEAMAMGLPVIASRVGGNIDAVVEGETGFLFEPGDDEALAGHILAQLDNPSKATALGEAGRRRVSEQFSMERFIDQMQTIYSKLTEDSVYRA